MSLTLRILIGLIAGLVVGALLGWLDPPWLKLALDAADLVGGLWLDALRMTVMPLVFALLVVGIAAAVGVGAAGGLAARSLIWFVVLLIGGATFSAFATTGLLALWPVPEAAVEGLRLGAAHTAPPEVAAVSGAWLRTFIPTNPIRAAVEDAVAPLTVFALLFGLAAARIAIDQRQRLLGVLEALAEVMLTIVQWVLLVGPYGVFALALTVGARAGAGAAGALLHYVVIISAVGAGLTLLMYPLAILGARLSPVRFARAMAPVQVVAFSTQSSIASLPAMIGAARGLGVGEGPAGVVLPLAVSLFRITSPAMNLAVAIYVAHVMGIPLTPALLTVGVLIAALMSFAAVGLPGQVSFFSTLGPICLAMGVPLNLLPLLLAVETIPDIFRTLGNVTADVTVTALATRGEGLEEEAGERA
jgi:proton glutamate symport protein